MFYRKQSSKREVKEVFAKVSIGATGAPTLSSSEGIASIARNSAGNYTVTLSKKYRNFVSANIIQLASSAEDLNFQILSEDVDVAKTVVFSCKAYDVDGAVAEADPSSGSILYISLNLQN